MLAPAFLLTLVFAYAPLMGWVLAFTKYKLGYSIFGGQWTGFLQFRRFLVDSSDFGYLIRNTLVINAVSVIQNLIVAVIFAVLLNEVRREFVAKTVQAVTFFPYFISWVISYSVVWSLLAVRSGAINQFLLGHRGPEEGINVMGDPRYAWPLMIYLNLWKYTGYNCIIFLAAIAGIPSGAVRGGRYRRSRSIRADLVHHGPPPDPYPGRFVDLEQRLDLQLQPGAVLHLHELDQLGKHGSAGHVHLQVRPEAAGLSLCHGGGDSQDGGQRADADRRQLEQQEDQRVRDLLISGKGAEE